MSFSFNIRFSTVSHWLYLPYPRSLQPDSTPLPCHLVVRSQTTPSQQNFWQAWATESNSSCLLIRYDLFNSQFLTGSQVPGTGNQSYMPRPSYTFPWNQTVSYICNDDVSTSCNTHVYLPTTRLYPLNPRSTTDDKSNNQDPIPFLIFSRDQLRRLGLGPTYAVSLSLDKIHCNFLQHWPTLLLSIKIGCLNTQKE